MGVLGNYYYDGTSFASATVLCTDADLLIPALDGWYSQGGIYRNFVSGILNTAVTCPSCVYGCSSSIISSSLYGKHIITVDIGNNIGAVLIEFTVPSPLYASRATWTWNSITASEYSSPNFGYCEGLIGDENIVGIDNTTGSGGLNFTGNNYVYQAGSFIAGSTSTWGPYANQSAGGVGLTPGGGYGTVIMVVPKTLAAPDTLQIVIDTTSVVGTNNFDLKVNCPAALPAFSALNILFNTTGLACANTDPNDVVFYHAVVSPLSTPFSPAVNDWVFKDENGDTPLINGFYRVFIGATYQEMQVINGVVVALIPC